MAEKGILIVDQAGGESVAVRDAIQQDSDDSVGRVIQLTDLVARGPDWENWTASNYLKHSESNDSTDLTLLANEVLDIGDASSVIVFARVQGGSNTSWKVKVTPVVMAGTPGNFEPVALLYPFFLQGIPADPTSDSNVSDFLYDGSVSVLTTIHPIQTLGARFIAFHVLFVDGNGSLYLYAYPASCSGRSYQIERMLYDGDFGDCTFPRQPS